MAKLKDGFYKQTAESVGSDSYVLLAGGGSKPLTDFALSAGNYVTLDTTQTITGKKLFNNLIYILSGMSISDENGNGVLGVKSTTWTGVPSDGTAISLGTLQNSLYFRSGGDNMYHYRTDKGTSYKVLDVSNYNSYAPTLTGGGASGTWDIDISGTASTVYRFTNRALSASKSNLNTKLSGGGVIYEYGYAMSNADNGLINAPANSLYGAVLQLNATNNNALAGQLAWDVNHRGTDSTRNLWWRANDDTDFANAKWHLIAFLDQVPYKSLLYSRNDYQYYVILLCKYGTGLTHTGHRVSGKIYSEGGGAMRYVAADIDIWVSDWSSSYESKLRFDTYGLQEMDLITCTYGGTKYLAIRIQGAQAKTVYFEGTSKDILFTTIHYYTSNTKTVVNSEIYNSITSISVDQPYSNGTKYALISEIPTVTNYYWANVKISSSSSTTTTPTFDSATASTQITTPKVASTDVLNLNAGTEIQFQIAATDTQSVVLNTTSFGPFKKANGKLSSGRTDARWNNVYSQKGNFSDTVYIQATSAGNYTEGIRLSGTAKDSTWSIINFGCDPAATNGTHSNLWLIGRDNFNRFVFRNNSTDLMYIYNSGNITMSGSTISLNYTKKALSSVGWYKIATDNKNVTGSNVILNINRNYSNTDNEVYTFLINCAYNGNTTITQIGGKANTQVITKIAVYNPPNPYDRIIYIYYNTTAANDVKINCVGDFTAVDPVAEDLKTSKVVEMNISAFGFKTNGNSVVSGISHVGKYLTFGSYGARFTSDVRNSWRTSIYGDSDNESRIRTVRTDATITDFSEIYGSGLTWATSDTQGYLSVSYSSGKAFIGGGNGDKLNWSTYLVTGNNIGSQSVNYATSAGNADTTDGLHLYTRLLGVNGTNWTFASTANSNATTHIYAPTSVGTSGLVLTSSGGTPEWTNQSSLSVGSASRLTLNGIADSTTYGTYAGIYQSNSNGPESDSWHNSLKILHNNSTGYYTQLAQNFTGSHGLWHRSNRAGTISRWYRVLDDLGGTLLGDLILYNGGGSGDSPALIFQRNTITDTTSLLDWKIYDTVGDLHFLNNYEGWHTAFKLNYLGGADLVGSMTATRFISSGSNQYKDSGGLVMNNSDIWGVNAIYTMDLANNATEGYQFKRTNGNYDSIWAADGTFYFSPNGSLDSGYSTNYTVIHSGNIGSQSVNYANSAGSATSADSCTGNAKGLSSSGYGKTNLTYYQTDGSFFGNSGWTHYIIANHGDGSSLYNVTIGLPFWGIPIYKRLESGTGNGWHTFITSENISSQSVNYASSAGNADTVDNLHASSLVKFYLSPMTSSAPADSAKSWFTDTMPSASGAIVYNVPGAEKTIIAGKSSGAYGHMLQLNYDDTYLRILRYKASTWQSTDWEKISAGYADSAGYATNADKVDGLHVKFNKLYYTSKSVKMETVLKEWYIKIVLSAYAQPTQILIDGYYNNQVDRAIIEMSGMSLGYIYRNVNLNSGNIQAICYKTTYDSTEKKWIFWIKLRQIDNRSSHYSPSSSATYTVYLDAANDAFAVTATTTAPTDVTWVSVNDANTAITIKNATLHGNADFATTASKLSTVSKTAWGQTYWTSGGVPTSISGNMTGVGSITMTGNINYTGTKATYSMIKFIDNTSDVNGNGIAIGGGGLTIVGSGESSDLFYSGEVGGGEQLILSSDSTITLYTNCQEGTSKAKSISMDTNGYLNTSYIHYGGHEKNASNPSYVAGFNSSDKYIRSYATSSLSVNYANSAGNADTLDGIDSTGFLRKITVANDAENDFNTFSNMTLTGRGDPATGASLKNAPWSGSGPAGGYGVLTYLWSVYGTQMAWGYNNNRIYIRNKYYSNNNYVWSSTWDSLALTSDIPTVTNYYWADIKISATSSTTTSPTVTSIRSNGYSLLGQCANAGDWTGGTANSSILGSSTSTIIRSSGDDLYHYNWGNATRYKILDSNNSSVSGGGSSWGSSITVKINGTSTTLTIPSNPNTDSNVYQSETTTSNYRPVVLGVNNSTTVSSLVTGVTSQVYTSAKFYAKPSTGDFYATQFNGILSVSADLYKVDSKYGINMNNSDIIGANGIYFGDTVDGAGEGIHFYRSSTTWDTIAANGGVLYFSANRATATHTLTPVFSSMANTSNQLDITIGGLNRKLTIAYSTSAGTASKITCTEGSGNYDRPVVVTDTSSGIYYTNKLKINYSTGKVTAANNIYAAAFYESSDRNLKENIQVLSTDLLDKVYNVKEVSFNWKESGKNAFGYIALDYEAISETFIGRNDDGTLSLNYTEVLVAQIAALKLKIVNLEERLHILERS